MCFSYSRYSLDFRDILVFLHSLSQCWTGHFVSPVITSSVSRQTWHTYKRYQVRDRVTWWPHSVDVKNLRFSSRKLTFELLQKTHRDSSKTIRLLFFIPSICLVRCNYCDVTDQFLDKNISQSSVLYTR